MSLRMGKSGAPTVTGSALTYVDGELLISKPRAALVLALALGCIVLAFQARKTTLTI